MARNQSRKLNEDIPDYWTWLQLQGMDPDVVEDNPDLDEWSRQQYDIMFGFKSPEDFDRDEEDEDLGEEWETTDGDIIGRNDVVIYQFPHLSRTDIRKAEEYGLEDVTQWFSDWNPDRDTFLRGELEDLESYGLNYIGGYQLADGYLFDDEGVSCQFVEGVAMRPGKKLKESAPVKEAYDPQTLKDYIVKYQDSADDMAEIWEDVYNETFDEDLANDVISGLEEIRDGADFNSWNDEWMECLKESTGDLDGFEMVGTLYDQRGKIHYILRKVGLDGSNIHGFWKAAPQGSDYGPDFSKAFDITYKQATGEDPLISLDESLSEGAEGRREPGYEYVIYDYTDEDGPNPIVAIRSTAVEAEYTAMRWMDNDYITNSRPHPKYKDRYLTFEKVPKGKFKVGDDFYGPFDADYNKLESITESEKGSKEYTKYPQQLSPKRLSYLHMKGLKGDLTDDEKEEFEELKDYYKDSYSDWFDESLKEDTTGDTYTFSRKCQLDPDLPDSGGYKVTLEDKEHGISFNIYWYKRSGYAASNANYLDLKCDDPKIRKSLFDALSDFEASLNCFTELKRNINDGLPAGSKVKYGPIENVQNPTIVRYSRSGYRYEYPNPHYTEKKDESLKEGVEDKVVIYKELGKYRATPESNYNNRIQDARKVQKLDAFESPDQIINYYIKYGWAKSPDEFIVDESLERGPLGEALSTSDVAYLQGDGLDSEQIELAGHIDWTNLPIEDVALFVDGVDGGIETLRDVARVEYSDFAGDYDGAYKITFKDGSTELQGWYHLEPENRLYVVDANLPALHVSIKVGDYEKGDPYYYIFPERHNAVVYPQEFWNKIKVSADGAMHFPSRREAIERAQDICDEFGVQLVIDSN